jgi:hypothetical protein
MSVMAIQSGFLLGSSLGGELGFGSRAIKRADAPAAFWIRIAGLVSILVTSLFSIALAVRDGW